MRIKREEKMRNGKMKNTEKTEEMFGGKENPQSVGADWGAVIGRDAY